MLTYPTDAMVEAAIAIRNKGGEPLCAYLYDLDALERHVRAVRAALPPSCELFYAIKANPEPPLLGVLAPLVDGFEASSGGEVAWLAQHGSGRPVIFGGPGKLDTELTQAIRTDIAAIHVESIAEIGRLATLAAAERRIVPVMIRVNPVLSDAIGATRLVMAGKPSPFGMDEALLPLAIAAIEESPWLRLDGFHVHAMSHQLDAEKHAALIALLFARFHLWQQVAGRRVDILNVGGGIGIDYRPGARQFDWDVFATRLDAAIDRHAMGDRVVRFELGRHLTGFCGCYATEIIDLKPSAGAWFAICRGGTHHFRLPSAQGHDHPLRLVRRGGESLHPGALTFVGQLCTPKDVFARDVAIEAAAIGDLVLFPLAGAYAWNISHQNFLLHPPPAMHFLLSPC